MLPNGPLDVVRQVVLFMAAYQLYRLTRGLVERSRGGDDGVLRTRATSSTPSRR